MRPSRIRLEIDGKYAMSQQTKITLPSEISAKATDADIEPEAENNGSNWLL